MIELEAELIEGTKNQIGAAGDDARKVEVFNADQPVALMLTSVQIASDRCDKRAEMQRTGGRGSEAAAISRPLGRGLSPIIDNGRRDRRIAFRDARGALVLPHTASRLDGLRGA